MHKAHIGFQIYIITNSTAVQPKILPTESTNFTKNTVKGDRYAVAKCKGNICGKNVTTIATNTRRYEMLSILLK